jgi:beta-galactosidase
VRRLAKENIVFTVSGEGKLIDDGQIDANPRAVEWGSAPVLVRSTRKAGKIRIHAEVQYPGTHAPVAAELEIESIPYGQQQMGDSRLPATGQKAGEAVAGKARGAQSATLTEEQKTKLLKEVEQQQADFGIGK